MLLTGQPGLCLPVFVDTWVGPYQGGCCTSRAASPGALVGNWVETENRHLGLLSWTQVCGGVNWLNISCDH